MLWLAVTMEALRLSNILMPDGVQTVRFGSHVASGTDTVLVSYIFWFNNDCYVHVWRCHLATQSQREAILSICVCSVIQQEMV